MDEVNSNISFYEANLIYRFQNNATEYCPLVAYQISRVKEDSTREWVRQSKWAQIFGLGYTNATFYMRSFETTFDRYLIYM